MKKIGTLLIFSIFVTVAMAQAISSEFTQRGNFVIGSRLGFATSKSTVDVQTATGTLKGDGGTNSQFNLSPNIGYFLVNNFVIGIAMDWLKTSSSNGIDLTGAPTIPQKSSNNLVLFGPFIRYFIPVGDDKSFFIGSTLGLGNSKNQFIANNQTQTINNSLLNVGVGPGFTIFSSNGLALEALVKYNFAKSKTEVEIQNVKRTSNTITNALDFSVGLQYYFRGFKSYRR